MCSTGTLSQVVVSDSTLIMSCLPNHVVLMLIIFSILNFSHLVFSMSNRNPQMVLKAYDRLSLFFFRCGSCYL